MAATKMVFNQMVLIFHLDISGSDFGRPMGSLLKYNALEDFQDDFKEVFQTTSKKSSRRLPGSLLTGSSSISKDFHRLLGSRPFRCIKSFKLVVHGGWCIDGNDNIVNT
uniref:Uncharacterized protein n=1 Tax=Brassica oleracea var. oleracea TaxID=109376 RepID=A0A0D3BG96_BRAOL